MKVNYLIWAIIAAFFLYGLQNYRNTSIKLSDISWSYFPGATTTSNGIHFSPLGRIIVHQDGSVGQPNPPVNIAGTHLKVKGDFKITITMSDVGSQSSFRIYSSPPLVYDQWRYETPSVEISLAKDLLTTRIWDGSSSNSLDMRTFKITPSPKTIITLEHVGNQINVLNDKQTLGTIPDHSIFDSAEIWFGADSATSSTGWTLNSLSVSALADGHVELVSAPKFIENQDDANSLRNLAIKNSRKIKVGVAVSYGQLLTDEAYRKISLTQFSSMTPENVMKPQFVQPQPNTYSFEEADKLVDIALKNKMTVHGHTLVYAKSSADWMIKSPIEDRQKIMLDHIKNVVTHFKGRVGEWDVVNEPFSQKNSLYKDGKNGLDQNIWYEAMGENYIDLAFNEAHKNDPSAKLYLNDYGVENDGQHWDALLSLVKRLKQRGVPIDGVGFETHIYTDGDYINADQLKNHMRLLNNLGLSTRISEIDVTGDDAQEQINQYKTALDICREAPNCTSYTTWGITDRYGSTTRSDRYPLVYGTSLLWDKDMQFKPAFTALQKILQTAN